MNKLNVVTLLLALLIPFQLCFIYSRITLMIIYFYFHSIFNQIDVLNGNFLNV